ncbi:MAG: hypothetical protein IKZ88_02915 [Neisseriaceae bacterium]|nr:hypothetical protein [Neisseriaceae bacterium]
MSLKWIDKFVLRSKGIATTASQSRNDSNHSGSLNHSKLPNRLFFASGFLF